MAIRSTPCGIWHLGNSRHIRHRHPNECGSFDIQIHHAHVREDLPSFSVGPGIRANGPSSPAGGRSHIFDRSCCTFRVVRRSLCHNENGRYHSAGGQRRHTTFNGPCIQVPGDLTVAGTAVTCGGRAVVPGGERGLGASVGSGAASLGSCRAPLPPTLGTCRHTFSHDTERRRRAGSARSGTLGPSCEESR